MFGMTKTLRPFLSEPEAAYAMPYDAMPRTHSADISVSTARLLKRDFMTVGSFRRWGGFGGGAAAPGGAFAPPARRVVCARTHAGGRRLDEGDIPRGSGQPDDPAAGAADVGVRSP